MKKFVCQGICAKERRKSGLRQEETEAKQNMRGEIPEDFPTQMREIRAVRGAAPRRIWD